jgi:hypothetical protein
MQDEAMESDQMDFSKITAHHERCAEPRDCGIPASTWLRLQPGGTPLKMKRWLGDIDDEPATPTTVWALTTDSTITGVGWAGIWQFTAGSGSAR